MTEEKKTPGFQKGNSLWKKRKRHGRRGAVNLLRAARERAEFMGYTLEEAMADVFEAMIQKAADGDVQAAKLLCDRMSHISDKAGVNVNVTAAANAAAASDAPEHVGPPIPDVEGLKTTIIDLRELIGELDEVEVTEPVDDEPKKDDGGLTEEEMRELF